MEILDEGSHPSFHPPQNNPIIYISATPPCSGDGLSHGSSQCLPVLAGGVGTGLIELYTGVDMCVLLCILDCVECAGTVTHNPSNLHLLFDSQVPFLSNVPVVAPLQMCICPMHL